MELYGLRTFGSVKTGFHCNCEFCGFQNPHISSKPAIYIEIHGFLWSKAYHIYPLSSIKVFQTKYQHVASFSFRWSFQGPWGFPLPQGSGFFYFDIQNFRNVTASGVNAPPLRGRRLPPPVGNPGSTTGLFSKMTHKILPFILKHKIFYEL